MTGNYVSHETFQQSLSKCLAIEGLKAGYGKTARIEIPNLEFPRGAITVVLGPNGSGKSTLLRCLNRTLRPMQGKIMLEERDIARLSSGQIARNIASMPQEAQFPFHFTPRELTQMGADTGWDGGESVQTRTKEALQRFEMDALADASLTSLSGGERQRAALARAFAQARCYLLLDEPTSHLDLRYQAILREGLRELATAADPVGVVIVLHDLNLAASFADRIALMDGGRVVEQGTPKTVLTEEIIARLYRTSVRLSHDNRTGESWLIPEKSNTP